MEWTSIVEGAYDCTISVGDAHADTVAATIQLKDFADNNLTVPTNVNAYLSELATGLDVSAVTLTTDLSASVGDREIVVAYKLYRLVSTAAGAITISISYTTEADDLYLVVVLPNGKKVVSSKFEFE